MIGNLISTLILSSLFGLGAYSESTCYSTGWSCIEIGRFTITVTSGYTRGCSLGIEDDWLHNYVGNWSEFTTDGDLKTNEGSLEVLQDYSSYIMFNVYNSCTLLQQGNILRVFMPYQFNGYQLNGLELSLTGDNHYTSYIRNSHSEWTISYSTDNLKQWYMLYTPMELLSNGEVNYTGGNPDEPSTATKNAFYSPVCQYYIALPNLDEDYQLTLRVVQTHADNDTLYQNGYTQGYSDGYSNGQQDGYTQGSSQGYSDGYASGSETGYANGSAEGAQSVWDQVGHNFGFNQLFGAIADTPLKILYGLFNFDLFGVSMIIVVLSCLTAIVLFNVIKHFIK